MSGDKAMKILGWINIVLGLVATGFGAIVLRGVLRVALRGKWTAKFLRYSLLASLAGLLPLTRHVGLIQGISMVSVYCTAAVILAWFRFHLSGIWRPVFAFLVTVVLYLNVVSLSIQFSKLAPRFAMAAMESASGFAIAQWVFALIFAVLGVLALRKCHAPRAC
jgi:hypothetical protein